MRMRLSGTKTWKKKMMMTESKNGKKKNGERETKQNTEQPKKHWIEIGKRSHKIVWSNCFFFLSFCVILKAAAMAATTTATFLGFKSMFNVCTKYLFRSRSISVAILLLLLSVRSNGQTMAGLGSTIYFGRSIEVTKRQTKSRKCLAENCSENG